jgi:hypothetical protein
MRVGLIGRMITGSWEYSIQVFSRGPLAKGIEAVAPKGRDIVVTHEF